MKAILFSVILCTGMLATGQNKDSFYDMMKKSLMKATSDASSLTQEFYINSARQLQSFRSTGIGVIQTFDTRYEGVKGSPYLYDDWQKGAVLITGNETPQIALLNYDCVNDQLLFRHQDGQPSSLLKEMVSSFIMEDFSQPDSLAYFIAIPTKKAQPEFFQVLYSGRTLLLEHQRKILRKADYQRAFSPDIRYDEYISANEIFIKTAEGDLKKVQPGKKDMISLFPEYKNQISDFIKKKDLKLKTGADLVSLVSYIDTL